MNLLKNQPPNLTAGSLWSNIWAMSWPMFLIMIFNFLVGLADIYVAGLISAGVQAAVGFISQLFFLTIIVANAISIGTLALISRAAGAGNHELSVEISKQSLILSLLIAIGLTFIGLAFHREIIAMAGFPDEIKEISENFLKVYALSLGPNYILIVSNAIFRATGEIKKPLLSMFLVSLINVIGDFVLVFGIFPFPRLGYIGIAVSTAISVAIGTSVNLIFFSVMRWRSLYSRPLKISTAKIKKIISLGWPAALLQIAWNAGSIILYNILARLGQESIAAMASLTNGLRIEAIIYLPAFALNMAASVLIGQNLGAGNSTRAERIGWHIAFAGAALISFMAIIIFIWAEHVASVFTRNLAVLEETTRYLRINMLSEPFMALSAVLGGGLQGAGDTKGTMWIIVIAMWLIRLPLAYMLALALDYGATGVWIAMITSMAVQGILMTWRFHKGHWKELRLD
ncbi:MAG: MATE family efflux transporter [Nitrospirota bacterium]